MTTDNHRSSWQLHQEKQRCAADEKEASGEAGTDKNGMIAHETSAPPVVPVRFDEEIKKKPLTEHEIAAGLLEKAHLLPPKNQCPHRSDPNNCLLCGTKRIRPICPVVPPKAAPEEIPRQDEWNARKFLGLPDPKPIRPMRPVTPENRRYPGPLRHLLGLTQDDIYGLLDKTVKVEEVQVVAGTVLKPTDRIENKIKRLKAEIADEQHILATMNKTHRADVDQKQREVYKRQSRAKIPRLESELAELEQRLANWAGNKRNYIQIKQLVKHEIKFREIFAPEDLAHYQAVLSLSITPTSRTTDWENLCIRCAIWAGVIVPPSEILEMYPYLIAEPPLNRSDDVDLAENTLILKSGGACIGGVIIGAGYRMGANGTWRQRGLESFDKQGRDTNPRRTSGSNPAHGDYYGGGGLDSGDYGEEDYH